MPAVHLHRASNASASSALAVKQVHLSMELRIETLSIRNKIYPALYAELNDDFEYNYLT